MNSLLTIIVPTIGRDTLEKALATVPKEVGVIVCGDGFLPELAETPQRTVTSTRQKYGSAGLVRNAAIAKAKTPWVGFLDDDDALLPGYLSTFENEVESADVIIFRMQHPHYGLIPKFPTISLGNVGISYAVKTEWAKQVPFVKENLTGKIVHEDFTHLRDLERAGAKVTFSQAVCYQVSPWDTNTD